jgi:hypothetical protein
MRERQAGRSSNAVCGLAAVFRANQKENSTTISLTSVNFSSVKKITFAHH